MDKRTCLRFGRAAAMSAALALGITSAAATQLAVSPWFPGYGTSVSVDLRDTRWPTYLPVSRYWRSGNTINVEYEYIADGYFGPRMDFADGPLAVGELAPGSYSLRAKLYDIGHPDALPQIYAQEFTVAPPDAIGVYAVPRLPDAFQPVDVVVKSDMYVDPASAKASVNGNVIRIDFDYAADAPVSGAAPAGFASFASAKVAGLAPGNYRIEGWARDRAAGTPQLRYSASLQIGTLSIVSEYYADSLDHYFISAWPDEKAMLDGAATPGFKRTAQQFRAWLRQADAPPNASPVCRFYASGPNSHFYTADPTECNFLKGLETKQRSDSQASGKRFEGWQFEAIAFYAVLPQNGACPGDTQPVWREYNGRATQNDSNHRFTVTWQMREAMTQPWSDEGVAFCAPL
jgi:hypothetical protein